MSIDDIIEHYGVKGQKWGVRKSASQISSARNKRRASSPTSKAKNLSDAELKSKVERLRLEKEYVTITKTLDNSSPVRSLLTKHGGQAASVAVGAATSAIVGRALKNAFEGVGKAAAKKGIKELSKKSVSFT